MTLLSLNDDVLLLIFSLLHGNDALHACLTCKRAYHLAIARVASSVQCWAPVRLRQLYDYYLSSDPFTGAARARYLENLTIHAPTFEPERSAPDSQDLNLDHVDDLDLEFDVLVGTDFSQAHLIGELLIHAQNIQELSLDRFHPLVRKEPRIALAFSAMHQLAHIRLAMVGDGTLDTLHSLRNPKRLTLSYHTYDDDPLDEPKTLPPLLTALASFPNLHTVKLWNFTPPHPDDSTTLPPLPSVRYLRLSQSSVPALEMVQLCPNLSTLVFSVDSDAGDVVASYGPRWRPLRRLMLAAPEVGVCVVDRVNMVRVLHVSGALELSGFTPRVDGDDISQFLELLRVASPVGLYAALRVEMDGFSSTFWKDIPTSAPRLRSLEIKLLYNTLQSGEDDNWLASHLVNALGNTPRLLVLKILVPPTPEPLRVFYSWEWDSDVDHIQAPAEAKAREMARVSALAALPRPLVDAIPSLRYLSVADMALNPALEKDAPEWVSDAASSRAEDGVVYEWDELREVDAIRKQMWWKIAEEDGRRTMVEISEDEGERAQRVVEDGDFEDVSQIEEALASLYL
ncbi:hypothetical protein LXA43DRAFT_1147952 [Ganoderma leucocontextum]|nr:hypothetical protein LXA43DRAFT_1147952 [Ganoderma leucocontextum]